MPNQIIVARRLQIFVDNHGRDTDMIRFLTELLACRRIMKVFVTTHQSHVLRAPTAWLKRRSMSADPKRLIRIARDTGPSSPVEPLDLGCRVRELRKAKGWTLEQAATQAGLARSTLSKIENGQMSPTYEALKKLAQGMAVSVPQLFTPAQPPQVSGRIAVTKSGEGQAHATTTYEHELLAAGLTKKHMLPYRATIRVRTMDDFDGWVRHEGEEFLFVLTGIVRLYTEFYEPVDLRRGDSAYYDGSMGHNVISLSQEDATILWVTSLI